MWTAILIAALLVVSAVAVFYRARSAALRDAATRSVESAETAIRAERRQRVAASAAVTRFVNALDRADFGILVVDAGGDVVFANPEAQSFIGARHGHAVAEARIRELLEEVVATHTDQSLELELYTPSHRYLGLRAVPLSDGSEPAGAALFLDDLSERHRVNAMRRDFVANASHELKTPLGALRALAETLPGIDDEATRERLTNRLLGEATRMSRLIDDILDLATIEGATTEAEPVYVKDLLNDAHHEVALLAGELGIPLEVDFPAGDLVVTGDRTQLASALSNLLENAIKYTLPGGRQKAEPVSLRAEARDGTVVITVEDHGIGIPESHRQRIFERFYRVDRARTRETGGTGLGLAIVRHVVLNHGGTVEVETEPGVGSTFRILLPRAEA